MRDKFPQSVVRNIRAGNTLYNSLHRSIRADELHVHVLQLQYSKLNNIFMYTCQRLEVAEQLRSDGARMMLYTIDLITPLDFIPCYRFLHISVADIGYVSLSTMYSPLQS